MFDHKNELIHTISIKYIGIENVCKKLKCPKFYPLVFLESYTQSTLWITLHRYLHALIDMHVSKIIGTYTLLCPWCFYLLGKKKQATIEKKTAAYIISLIDFFVIFFFYTYKIHLLIFFFIHKIAFFSGLCWNKKNNHQYCISNIIFFLCL